MVKIYTFHPEHFYYTGVRDAKLDPLAKQPILPGKLHPSRTLVAPPKPLVGYARVFDMVAETWSQVEDPLGLGNPEKTTPAVVYDKETRQSQKVTLNKNSYNLGPLPANWTTKAPQSEWDEFDEATDSWAENTTKKAAYEAEKARTDAIRISAFITEFEDLVRGKTLSELNTIANSAFVDFNPATQKFLKYLLAKTALEVQ